MDGFEGRKGSQKKQIGLDAEKIAAAYLESHGYRIIDRNFYCKAGELDIIAIQNEELVFVEVRSRHSEESLSPLFTLTDKKRRSIKKAAQVYVTRKSIDRPLRFDFIVVTMTPEPQIEIFENVFFELPSG